MADNPSPLAHKRKRTRHSGTKSTQSTGSENILSRLEEVEYTIDGDALKRRSLSDEATDYDERMRSFETSIRGISEIITHQLYKARGTSMKKYFETRFGLFPNPIYSILNSLETFDQLKELELSWDYFGDVAWTTGPGNRDMPLPVSWKVCVAIMDISTDKHIRQEIWKETCRSMPPYSINAQMIQDTWAWLLKSGAFTAEPPDIYSHASPTISLQHQATPLTQPSEDSLTPSKVCPRVSGRHLARVGSPSVSSKKTVPVDSDEEPPNVTPSKVSSRRSTQADSVKVSAMGKRSFVIESDEGSPLWPRVTAKPPVASTCVTPSKISARPSTHVESTYTRRKRAIVEESERVSTPSSRVVSCKASTYVESTKVPAPDVARKKRARAHSPKASTPGLSPQAPPALASAPLTPKTVIPSRKVPRTPNDANRLAELEHVIDIASVTGRSKIDRTEYDEQVSKFQCTVYGISEITTERLHLIRDLDCKTYFSDRYSLSRNAVWRIGCCARVLTQLRDLEQVWDLTSVKGPVGSGNRDLPLPTNVGLCCTLWSLTDVKQFRLELWKETCCQVPPYLVTNRDLKSTWNSLLKSGRLTTQVEDHSHCSNNSAILSENDAPNALK